jgi:hypothetical protein
LHSTKLCKNAAGVNVAVVDNITSNVSGIQFGGINNINNKSNSYVLQLGTPKGDYSLLIFNLYKQSSIAGVKKSEYPISNKKFPMFKLKNCTYSPALY